MGSIYKLTDGEQYYYGSTTTTLQQRLAGHKCPANKTISNILNRDNLTIELMEEVEDESQLRIREQYYLDNYECVNIKRAHNTPEQWQQHLKQWQQQYWDKNKDKINKYKKTIIDKTKGYNKKYYETNRDKIIEKARTKYTCECGADLSYSHKARHEKTQKHINKIG